ncbi:MAG: hypothetical protein EPN68_11730 [Rhodanobacter sp.]|nr:MAG: hypothetical protein EPN68_11730 [Rhodanobacter sp.]
MSRHVIDTLSWVCRGTDPRQGFAQQQHFSEFLHGPGRQVLDALFDRLSPSDEVWRIDRLDIELGALPADANFDDMAQQLESALETELQQLRRGEAPDTSAGRPLVRPLRREEGELDNFLYYLAHGRLHWSMPAMGRGDMANWLERLALRNGPRLWQALRQLPHTERIAQRLGQITPCHGLQALLAQRHPGLVQALDALDDALLEPLRAQGRLSVYQMDRIRQAWRVAGLHALWGQTGSGLDVARVQRLLSSLGDALIMQLGAGWAPAQRVWLGPTSMALGASDLQRSLLLGMQMRLFGDALGSVAQVSAVARDEPVADVLAGTRAQPFMLNAGWHESLRQFALAHHGAPTVRAAGLGLSELQAYLLDFSLAYLATVDRVPQDHVAWQVTWQRALRALDSGVDAEAAAGLAAGAHARPSAETPERPRVKSSRNADGSISPADDHPDNEAIYIVNAGLVLLANYAPRLFGVLGLVRDGAFVDEAARHRAVHCLVYLSDGHVDSEEHEWVLNKLLCGVPIDEVVPLAVTMDELRPVLDDLLGAVIAHWKALGHTTPDGLRKTFLRRLGSLVEHEAHEGEHWRLKMQPGPFDVLLDQLPWAYGTIKLPWMKGAIHVDWR